MNQKELPKAYDPTEVESKWYQFWQDKNYFHAEADPDKKSYCITIPPPNITGSLHMGHALCYTIQDILGRWKRMQGFNTLILPGTDHAGIATQNVVEKQLKKKGLTRHDIGREKFLEKVWEWRKEYGGTIINQFKRMGYSFDWSRERFTLDKGYEDAVKEAFVRLHKKGYIYRGTRVINWCPRCRTAISDIEMEYKDLPGHLWHIRYPFADGSGSIIVATTRPETMLGDTAVAVNPKDPRYAGMIGKKLILPLVNREIPLIGDGILVDLEFGTGAVKVTPAHDPNDFEAGLRNHLEQIIVIDPDGKMTAEAGKYAGLDRDEARKAVVEALDAEGYLVKVEDYSHSVGTCERCGTVIEPLLSEQWFVKMKELAQPAIQAVKEGKIQFVPDRYTKVYIDWMENVRDWCISRQLWWGHRIPIWNCEECGHHNVAKEAPAVCEKCGSTKLTQDPDVLDTWFSSALWPFATLGWPQQTPELKSFFPTDVLVTAREILYLWVARMIFDSMEFMDEIPFKEVYIYATVLNKEGRRMSKSLGTGIDPLLLIDDYGADATRFGIVMQAGKGQDMRFGTDRTEMARNFANKIWNAARFVLMNLGPEGEHEGASKLPEASQLNLADRWILSRMNETIRIVNQSFAGYDFDEACKALYTFIWSEFCDWYVELAKPRMQSETPDAAVARAVLSSVLETTLRMLHPLMPFISEEIWQAVPHDGESIMKAAYPEFDESLVDSEAEDRMNQLMELTRSIRNLRAELGVAPGKEIHATLAAPSGLLEPFKNELNYVQSLSKAVINVASEAPAEKSLSALTNGINIYVPISGLIDVEKESKRLEGELARVEKELKRVNTKLSNEQFLNKAPADVVEKEQKIRRELIDQRTKIIERQELING